MVGYGCHIVISERETAVASFVCIYSSKLQLVAEAHAVLDEGEV